MQFKLNSGDTLKAVLAGAKTSVDPSVKVSYRDTKPQPSKFVALNGTTPVTLMEGTDNSSPIVEGLTLCNSDTGAITVTFSQVVGGTSHTALKVTLAVDDTLIVDDEGVRVIDVSGDIKTSTVANTGNLSLDSAGKITDANGNELIKFPSTVASAINELQVTNAAAGDPVDLAATGGDTDINLQLTPKGAGLVVANGPLQVRDSVAVTATTGGGTTGLIPAGSTFVVVTSDSADKQISLPAASVGDVITILVGSTACELISAVAAHKVNEVTVGATNELALTAEALYTCRYTKTNYWIVTGETKLGARIAALVPDSL